MSRALGSADGLTANPLAGIDAVVAEQLLGEALASGGEYADLYFEFRCGADFVLEEAQVRSVGRVLVVGLGVRVLRGDATGYAYTEELSSARMREAARTAGQIAAAGRTVAPVALTPLPGSDTYPVPESSLARPGRDKVALLRRADAAARAFDARIVRVEASLSEEWREILVFTSDGRLAQDRQPMLRLGVHAVAEEGGRRQGGRSGTALRRGLELFALPGHAPEEHGREAARIALAMLHAQEAPAGPMEVVLGPGESGILLHEAVGHGLEADFNRKKTSNYTDQIGKLVASQLCSVVDDATVGHAWGSVNVDDEGNPGRRNLLAGKGPAAELERVSKGLCVTDLMGFGFNPVTGDWSQGANGFWIDNGSRVHPVSEITISINFDDLWKNIDGVGDDLDTRSSVQSPSLRVSRITVAGT